MPKQTPFFAFLRDRNETEIWKTWSGYLVPSKLQHSISKEYYAIRNSVSLLDTSPLYKYRFVGEEAITLLRRSLVRDIGRCEPGAAQYTVFCDDRGFVLQDGVVLRVSESEYWLTTAEPALRYFRQLAKQFGLTRLDIDDITEAKGILAIQGPLAGRVMNRLSQKTANLKYFGLTQTEIDGADVVVSRTGYTGDLGYEVWCDATAAATVWQAIVSAGTDFELTPIGTTAMKMARVEAGLLLMDVDFESSRFAWVDQQRSTPDELSLRWMLRDLARDDRDFIGRSAIERERRDRTTRWQIVGLEFDVDDYNRVFLETGIPARKFETYSESKLSVYRRSDRAWDYAGHVSSFLYSSLLKRPIAIARLPLDLSLAGTEVDVEVPVLHRPELVIARVAPMPFYNPDRKTAMQNQIVTGAPL